jgi:hypothetical protein
MSFSLTRHTLIQRIASAGDDRGWREFLADDWGRFVALRVAAGR